jgi:hypothetical protein
MPKITRLFFPALILALLLAVMPLVVNGQAVQPSGTVFHLLLNDGTATPAVTFNAGANGVGEITNCSSIPGYTDATCLRVRTNQRGNVTMGVTIPTTARYRLKVWDFTNLGSIFRVRLYNGGFDTGVLTVPTAPTASWSEQWLDLGALDIPAGSYTLEISNGESGTLSSYDWYIKELFIYYHPDDEPEPPPPPPPPGTIGVPITATCVINSGGISSTIPANIVPNWSYETGQTIPNDWDSPDVPSNIPAMWERNKLDAAHGQNYITAPATATRYETRVTLPQPGRWLVGLYAKGTGSFVYSFARNTNDGIQSTVVVTGSEGGEWLVTQFVADVPEIGGTDQSKGSRYLTFDLEPGDYDIDAVFVIPVTNTAGITNTGLPTDTAGLSVYCPALQPVETETPNQGNVGLYPVYPAWNGSGAYCQTCPIPGSMLRLGEWVAWLGCVLTNLFFCWLRSWIDSLISLGLSIFAFMGSAVNSLMTGINQILIWFGMVWDVVIYAIESVWGWFAQLLAWLGDAIYSVALWLWGIGQTIWGVYIPTTIARLWVFAIWVGDGVNAVIGWVWDSGASALVWLWELGGSALVWVWELGVAAVTWLWETGAYAIAWLLEGIAWLWANLDPLTLLIWLLNLPPVQALLSAGMGGYIIVNAMGIAISNLSTALLELWDLLLIVVNAFRGVFAADDYVIILNTSGGEIETVDPGALGASGMNGTKMLWLGLSAIATADYMVEIFPLEIPLIMTIGILAWGIGAWTLSQWKEIINW